MGTRQRDGKEEPVQIVHTVIPGLRVEDIDFVQKVLAIRSAKGDKDRLVPVDDETLVEVRKYLDGTDIQTGKLFDLSTRQVEKLTRRYCKKAGIKKEEPPSPHWFRHTFCIYYLRGGGNIRALQQILGHSSLSITQVYLDVVAIMEESTRVKLPF